MVDVCWAACTTRRRWQTQAQAQSQTQTGPARDDPQVCIRCMCARCACSRGERCSWTYVPDAVLLQRSARTDACTGWWWWWWWWWGVDPPADKGASAAAAAAAVAVSGLVRALAVVLIALCRSDRRPETARSHQTTGSRASAADHAGHAGNAHHLASQPSIHAVNRPATHRTVLA